jgi:hypothetical protein
VVSRVAFEEAEQVTARCGVDDLINPQQPEGVLGVVFVEISVVDAHPPLVRVFLRARTGLASHSRWKTSLMKPSMSSLASSFLMALRRSSAKQRRCCHLGVALGSMLSEFSISLLGTLGMSAGFQEKMSRLTRKKLTSTYSYFGSRPTPIMVVLLLSPIPRSITLTCTSSDG